MKELTQHIRLQPTRLVITDAFDLMADQPFTLQFNPQTDADGTCWQLEQSIPIELPDSVVLRIFSSECCVVASFWDSSRRYDVGRRQMPARAWITRHLNTAMLHLRCTSTLDPLA